MPRLTAVIAEIGTTGSTARVEMPANPHNADSWRGTLYEAVEHEHPCEDDNTCDIAAAVENDCEWWAAHLLQGATECPVVDAVIAQAVRVLGPAAIEAEIEADRVYLLDHVSHVDCPSCGALVWGEGETVCDNCRETLPELSSGTFTLTVDLGNAGMGSRAALAELLAALAEDIEQGHEDAGSTRDVNGNIVARWAIGEGDG